MQHCARCSDPGLKYEGPVTGAVKSLEENSPIKAYVTGSSSDTVIVYASDIFGCTAPTAHKVADYLSAQTGYQVVIPDLFAGDPLPMSCTREQLGQMFPAWLPRHNMADSIKLIDSVIALLQEQGAKSFVLVGFCWGGLPVMHQLTADNKPHVKAGFIAHPSRFADYKDFGQLKKPLYIACAESDPAFPQELVQVWQQTISSNLLTVSHHPGCEHGFVCRPSNTTESKEQMVVLAAAAKFLGAH